MRPASTYLPPRQSVVYGYTRRMLDETATNAASFAMQVAESYLAMTAPDVRTVPFRLGEGDDLLKAMRNNAQILRRYMDGSVKTLPADLEDAWVLALPEPYRCDCERDLAGRRGRLSMRQITEDAEARAVGIAQLVTDFGQLLEALGPALVDGEIDEKDLPYARRILGESDDLIAQIVTVRKQVIALLPGDGDAIRGGSNAGRHGSRATARR